jgi:hypothetical protein
MRLTGEIFKIKGLRALFGYGFQLEAKFARRGIAKTSSTAPVDPECNAHQGKTSEQRCSRACNPGCR